MPRIRWRLTAEFGNSARENNVLELRVCWIRIRFSLELFETLYPNEFPADRVSPWTAALLQEAEFTGLMAGG